ncbi:MAG: UDP-N-acetylglucosamine--N-acetylmuramyl-(pentapeptide) pyrophosphoryl-undecaprenol N-acetylglucosamine transferase [Dehalococcoidia bacterium]
MALSGGGTAGHVYPCLAVVSALRERLSVRGEPLTLLYLGIRGRVDEQLLVGEGIEFQPVRAGALRVRSPLRFASGLVDLALGAWQARRVLRRFDPQAVFATGGYASAPVALAARSLGRPLLVYLPDVRPGWAVRMIARLANRVAVTVEGSLPYFPRRKAVVTGYPARPDFATATREEGRRRLGLEPATKTLLVAGGSLGARSINNAVAEKLPSLLELCQLAHLSGAADFDRLKQCREALPDELRGRHHLYAYLPEMPLAMAAGDLALMRAGASTLGELPLAGLPAVLVPGAFSDQGVNARYLAERGAALVFPDERVTEAVEAAKALLQDDERLQVMSNAMRALAQPDAADRIAGMLMEIAA